jgi:hypothetical protein
MTIIPHKATNKSKIISKKMKRKKNRNPLTLWFERGMALLALANVSLVIFDLSYIPFRDFWLHGRVQMTIKIGQFEKQIPERPLQVLPFNITPLYDWVKGIEPNRDTEQYLKVVEELNNKINQVVLQKGGEYLQQEQQEIDRILAELRQRSIEMINTNPFQIANKTGTLERIKNNMRVHVFNSRDASAKDSFTTFWSREHLSQNGFRQELNFFERDIQPLIETNYFRPVGETGKPIDNFGILDFPFFMIFLGEFLVRTWLISRKRTGVSWVDAMLWRWYDIFFLIPVFRWLRIIPTIIRLSEAELIDLHKIQKQASQGFVAGIAEDITEVVIIRIINQIQAFVKEGEVGNFLAQQNTKEYIDINNTNEVVEISKLLINMTVYQVMPKLQPDLEALMKHSIDKIVHESMAYQGLQRVPGFQQIKNNITNQLVTQIYQTVHKTLDGLLQEDPVFDKLLQNIVNNFSKSITSEIQAQDSIDQLESLLIDFLEEIKINYVERLSEEDVEDILEQTRALHQIARTEVI